MKSIAILLFALCCYCGGDAEVHESRDTLSLCGGASGCSSDSCSLVSLAHTLGSVGQKVETMTETVRLLETRMLSAEKELKDLRSLIGGAPRVAFSAALKESGSGNVGPFNTATPLQYKRVFSNTGNDYSPATGIFRATVGGMYFFRFSMFNNLSSPPSSVVSLVKNGERLVSVWDTTGSDSNDMGSNAAVVPLAAGDTVYVELQANRMVYDDSMNYNTFSGFLLFPL